jgi:2-amino-4-hydroxy-6-hydroxymethyldihydropteridine diphosphokinase
MILIGLGGNLSSAAGPPQATFAAVLADLPGHGVTVEACSPWYETEPQPPTDQPWFVNGVAAVATRLDPAALLAALHGLEAAYGRERSTANAARTLDLDLLAYGDLVTTAGPVLPHPRLHLRAFVLRPLVDIAPQWRHPVLARTATDLLAALPPDQGIRPLAMPPKGAGAGR